MDERICRAFRVMKGGMDNVGWKPVWWTKEYEDDSRREWFVAWQVTDAEWIILDVLNRFEKSEKELIVMRYGRGRVLGYRKMGKMLKKEHWRIFEQFQPVAKKLKKYLDEKPLLHQ